MSKTSYCVYMHTNKINNKKYIGQTNQKATRRWRNGKGYLNKNADGVYAQRHFAGAILKYGWDNFEHEILCENLTLEEANIQEEYYINKYNTTNPDYGYNIRAGGNNKELSEETLERLRLKNIGRVTSEETKQKLHIAMLGREVSEETLRKKSIPIICVETDTEYYGISAAAKTLNLNIPNLIDCLHGITKLCGGYHWKYVDENLNHKYAEQRLEAEQHKPIFIVV